MNKGAGFTILAAVAFAALRFSAAPPAAQIPVESVATVPPPRQIVKPLAPSGRYLGGCTAFNPDTDPKSYPRDDTAGTAKSRIDTFFQLGDHHPGANTEAELKARTGVHYAVALVPDPHHTNLSVMFDRQIVALQQAAQTEGYVYDSSWLPWTQGAQASPLLADQQFQSSLADAREACPGVMLFRQGVDVSDERDAYDNALVVLLVGEQPTAGLNEIQWANAMQWLAANAAMNPSSLRIIGPTFSGSLVSLHRDLQHLPAGVPNSVQILSGSISSCSAIAWFDHAPTSPNISFGTFQENDELHIDRFLRYVASQNTYAREVAILSEDETAYGSALLPVRPAQKHSAAGPKQAGAAPPATEPNGTCAPKYREDNRPLRLYYPRDMSSLRFEYQKEGVFQAPTAPGTHTVHSILQDGAETDAATSRATDSVPAFSGPVTPLSQEAILYSIVGNLHAHHARYVLLRCTNPLDYLFLIRFFHRAYPEGRLVIVGQDILLRREIDTTEFRGVLSLSNYPLLPLDQHWTTLLDREDDSPHSHLIFESHIALGTFLAARYSFSTPPFDQGKPQDSSLADPRHVVRTSPSSDYTDPFWLYPEPSEPQQQREQPPTWLTVVGRDGFWPVAVLNEDTLRSRATDKEHELYATSTPVLPTLLKMIAPLKKLFHYEDSGADSAKPNTTQGTTQPDAKPIYPTFSEGLLFDMPTSWKVCSLLAILLVLYQCYGVSRFMSNPSSGIFSVFRMGSAPSQQILLGLNCAITVALLAEVASVALALPRLSLVGSNHWAFLCCQAAPVVGAGLIVAALIGSLQSIAYRYVFLPLGILGAYICWSFRLSLNNNNAANVSLFYRMSHLTSGVSPLLPVLLISAGFYFWSWQTLAGNLLLCNGRPLLPRLACQPPQKSKLRVRYDRFISWLTNVPVQGAAYDGTTLPESQYRVSEAMDKRITILASPLSAPMGVALAPLLVCLIFCALFMKNLPLVSLEGYLFRFAINAILFLAFLVTLTDTLRLFWLWKAMATLLAALNRMRLRRTFAKLRAMPASSLWSMSGNVQRIQYMLFNAQLDAAIRLGNLLEKYEPSHASGTVITEAVCFGRAFATYNADKLTSGPEWDTAVFAGPELQDTPRQFFIREVFQRATTDVMTNILAPAWRNELTSLSLDTAKAPGELPDRNVMDMKLHSKPIVAVSEEFVCLHYIAFIQNMLARMRTLVLSMIFLFVAGCLAISFYPFVPRTQVSVWLLLNLVVVAFTVIYVYAGMERDEIISYITNTKPGHLSSEFWLKTAGFLTAPVIGILTTQFPGIADSVLGWLQPGLDAFK